MYIVCREAQEKKMKAHVNGWETIERQLSQLGRKQGELARLLQITPAAVSQVKKGVYLLNPKQLEKIVQPDADFTFLEERILTMYANPMLNHISALIHEEA